MVLILNKWEKLNSEIFKQVAREKGININKVRGTGFFREFVPEYMKADIRERHWERNAWPNSWSDDNPNNDGIIFNSRSQNNLEPSSDSKGKLKSLDVSADYDIWYRFIWLFK